MEIKYQKNFNKKNRKIILPYLKDKPLPIKSLQTWLQEREKARDFTGDKGEIIHNYEGNKTYFLIGLGNSKELNAIKIRSNFALAIKNISSYKFNKYAVFIPEQLKPFLQEIGEGIILGNYSLSLFQTGINKKMAQEKIIKKIVIVGSTIFPEDKKAFEKGVKIGEAVNYVRDLINSPHNMVDAKYLVEEGKKIAKKNHYKFTLLDHAKLVKIKMWALLAVNQGSTHGAKLLILEHSPLGKKYDPIVLVGKGVTFDTGGINLKPSAGLKGMKIDMAGCAVVLGVFQLLKKLNIQKNVIAVLPITDNVLDGRSIKPHDIITGYSGKTIEILNTDAEGRLILSDAISYAVKHYQPSRLIDLATLTGACMVALGEQIAGLFGNNEKLIQEIQTVAAETDEEVWHMPIHEFHRQEIKGTLSDLTNLGNSGYGGASTAAAFLENFVEDIDWAHLDIAGVTQPKKTKDIDFPGSVTGYGVRLLIQLLENIKSKEI